MLENGKPKDLFTEDGLHINAKGYAIWTVAMLPHTNAEAGNCRRQNKQ